MRIVRLRRRAIGDLEHGRLQAFVTLVGRLHEEGQGPGGQKRSFDRVQMLSGHVHVSDCVHQRAEVVGVLGRYVAQGAIDLALTFHAECHQISAHHTPEHDDGRAEPIVVLEQGEHRVFDILRSA